MNRHALDFRLMSGARVAILDASNSLLPPLRQGDKSGLPPVPDSDLVLKPIPNFRAIVEATCREVDYTGSKVTSVDIGVICQSSAVRAIGRVLYEKVRQALKGRLLPTGT